MSDTIFFQILESGSLVDLHTKFGGSNSKGRKKCHCMGGVLCLTRIWANRPCVPCTCALIYMSCQLLFGLHCAT